MSTASPIKLTRHPPERRRSRPLPIACGCSCCCCCCLHTLGSLAGAIWASRLPKPEPMVLGPLQVRTAGAPGESAGGSRPQGGLSAPAEKVLGAFAVYWAADRLRGEGRYPEAAFTALAGAVRERAEAVWQELAPGGAAEIAAWMLVRIHMLVDEGLIPIGAVEHFKAVLAPRAGEKGTVPQRGGLAQLFRVHRLYQEVAAAVDAGVVPVESLGLVRERLIAQSLQAAAQMGAFSGSAARGRFSGPVLAEARRVLAGLPAGSLPTPAAAGELEAVLSGSGAAPTKSEGTCPICGDLLFAWPVVRCMVCETPHHEGCWDYNQRCASFACGSTETVEGPGKSSTASAPAPAAPAFDVRGGSGRETESRPEARAISAFWMISLGILGLACLSLLRDPFALILVALAAPAVMLSTALLVIVGALIFGGPGRWKAAGAAFRIGKATFLGGIAGIAAMVGLWFVFAGIR